MMSVGHRPLSNPSDRISSINAPDLSDDRTKPASVHTRASRRPVASDAGAVAQRGTIGRPGDQLEGGQRRAGMVLKKFEQSKGFRRRQTDKGDLPAFGLGTVS